MKNGIELNPIPNQFASIHSKANVELALIFLD